MMSGDSVKLKIDSVALIGAVSGALQRIDARLISHGERVAYIACELLNEGKLPLDEEKLLLLSVFHDIGAYKTDEIDRMVEFETGDVRNHAVYGYLFLKYMSPLSEIAGAILYHHTPWPEIADIDDSCKEYAALIHIADRMDIAFLNRNNKELYDKLIHNDVKMFRPEYIRLADRCFKNGGLYGQLINGSYREVIMEKIRSYNVSAQRALEFVKMMVYSVDFRSEFTVTHTVNTVAIAMNIARHFGMGKSELDKLYIGALLHDVGKIAIPTEILENPGRLTPEQMDVMRGHVVYTEKIIRDIVPADICNIAVRHHEKLDGTGYPYSLTGGSLDMSQRIVAVADIVSALAGKRSYKEPFPRERVIEILREMKGTQLDERICEYVCTQYDTILEQTDNSRNEVIRKYRAMLDEYELLKA